MLYAYLLAAPVSGVVAHLYNSTAFEVEWNELTVSGWNISGYVVYYRAYSAFLNRTVTQFSTSVPGGVLETHTVVNSLNPDLEHQFQVSAVLATEGKESYEADKSQATKVVIGESWYG